jgi:hypothetical protein
MSSTENRVETVAHRTDLGELVGQTKVCQNTKAGEEGTEAYRLNGPVDVARLVADANGHPVTPTVTGFLFQGGNNFVVIGANAWPLYELGMHGILTGSDARNVAYIEKYLRAVLVKAGWIA